MEWGPQFAYSVQATIARLAVSLVVFFSLTALIDFVFVISRSLINFCKQGLYSFECMSRVTRLLANKPIEQCGSKFCLSNSKRKETLYFARAFGPGLSQSAGEFAEAQTIAR